MAESCPYPLVLGVRGAAQGQAADVVYVERGRAAAVAL